jgi:ATP adenylyltransferase
VKKTGKKAAQKKTTKGKKPKGLSSKILNSDLGWPMRRQVFFRPGRKKYVRKENREPGCVFCKAATAKPSEENLCVYKSKYSQIVLNKFPYNNGHVLVLPLRHCGDLLELSPNEYSDLHHTLRVAIEAVKKIYEPAGMNLGMNHGSSAGAGIPDHLHYHVVPRWNGDVNFFPLIAETKVVIETLEESYKNFIDYFAELSREGQG